MMWEKLDLWGKNPNTAKKFAMGIGFLGLGFLVFAYLDSEFLTMV